MEVQTLLSDFFRQDDLNRLAADSAAILDCPLMIVDETFHIVAHAAPADFRDKVFGNAVSHGEITYEASAMISTNAEVAAGHAVYVELEDSPFTRRFAPLITSGLHLGYLVCVDVDGHLRTVPDGTFQTVECVLAKQLFMESTRQDKLFDTAEEVLEHLLDGGFSAEPYFRLQASSTYLADFHPKAFALIDLEGYHNRYLGSNRLKDELMYHFYASHPFLYHGDVFLFLHEGYDAAALQTLAEEFHLKVLISNPIDKLFDLPQLYRSAKEAAKILVESAAEEAGVVFTVAALSPLILLTALKDHADLIDEKVNRLAAYDAKKDSQYCETLYRYLISGNSLKETCEALFTHRNTVLYRIRRMKEDFALPLDDPAQHLNLLLSVSLTLLRTQGAAFFLSEDPS